MAAARRFRIISWNEVLSEGRSGDKAKGICARLMWQVTWKRKYWGWAPDEGWFILTNLPDLESAVLAYKKREGIE